MKTFGEHITLNKVTVEHKYTYVTDLDLKVGERVFLPDSGYGEWVGKVTSLNGTGYKGKCKKIVKRVDPESRDFVEYAHSRMQEMYGTVHGKKTKKKFTVLQTLKNIFFG